jgi:hypothetical protein
MDQLVEVKPFSRCGSALDEERVQVGNAIVIAKLEFGDAAACHSYPALPLAPLNNEVSSQGSTPRPNRPSSSNTRDARHIQSA